MVNVPHVSALVWLTTEKSPLRVHQVTGKPREDTTTLKSEIDDPLEMLKILELVVQRA